MTFTLPVHHEIMTFTLPVHHVFQGLWNRERSRELSENARNLVETPLKRLTTFDKELYYCNHEVTGQRRDRFDKGQTPKSDIPPNIAQKNVTPENYLQMWDSSATLIGQLAIVTLFGAILRGIPLSGAYP